MSGFSACEQHKIKRLTFDLRTVAVVALERTVQLLVEKGRFRQAADRQKSIAEILKADAGDPEKSYHAYVKAADWYSQEGAAA